MLIEVINISRNIQVSRSLPALRGRHVVMFQMKVRQVALSRQLAYDVASGFTFCFSAQNGGIFLALLVPVWQLEPAILKVLFFSSLVQLKVVLEEPRVEDLRHQ